MIMVINFNCLDYKEIIKSILLFINYTLILRIQGVAYSFVFVSQLNLNELLSYLYEISTLSIVFTTGIVITSISVIATYLKKSISVFYDDLVVDSLYCNNQAKIILTLTDVDLDFSNPFLYAGKTLGLLE